MTDELDKCFKEVGLAAQSLAKFQKLLRDCIRGSISDKSATDEEFGQEKRGVAVGRIRVSS